MKATGIVRKIDELGRIVIPKELRRTLNIADSEDSLEIFTEDEMIIMKKYTPSCMFCNDARNLIVYKGHNICKSCLEEINRSAE